MAATIFDPSAIKVRGRSEARAVGVLLMAAAGLVLLSVALPHPSGSNTVALLTIAAAMLVSGILCRLFPQALPVYASHAVLAATAAATGLLIYEAAIAAGQFGSIFVWIVLVASYFFPRKVAFAHVGWILLVYAIALAVVPNTAGYSPVTRWLFSAVSLTVVALFTSVIVARRAQADRRARRFFELSQDMLCTLDSGGRIIEANEAWKQWLGYSSDELRGRRLIDFTHPEDHERAIAEAIGVFKGEPSVNLEARVVAKDGSWHWLRSSAALAGEEDMLYARATDVTELKRIAAERESLLDEVADMARSDALTGLPNRRALNEALPRELARARRSEGSLCLAILDLDYFKAYNDTHGHLAGDEMLRDCAVAWDSELRAEDMLVRYGGEEFLAMLPDTDPEYGLEIIERLREATPGAQTCSAGLAIWDGTESVDDLLGRADSALYMAKAGGRDLVVQASTAA